MYVKPALLFWVGMSALGGLAVALPDRGPRVVALSGAHGPSALDLAGIVILVAGWLPLIFMLWHRRDRLRQESGHRMGLLAVFSLGLGSGPVVTSVLSDYTGWWMMGALSLIGAQLLLIRVAAD